MNDWNIISDKSDNKMHDFDVNPTLQGVLVNVKKGVGANNSTIYEVKVGSETVAFWGSSVLDARLEQVSVNDEVRIKYLGKKKSDKTGRTYKEFEVANRKPVVTFDGDWSK
jgi:hypothetical protein